MASEWSGLTLNIILLQAVVGEMITHQTATTSMNLSQLSKIRVRMLEFIQAPTSGDWSWEAVKIARAQVTMASNFGMHTMITQPHLPTMLSTRLEDGLNQTLSSTKVRRQCAELESIWTSIEYRTLIFTIRINFLKCDL